MLKPRAVIFDAASCNAKYPFIMNEWHVNAYT